MHRQLLSISCLGVGLVCWTACAACPSAPAKPGQESAAAGQPAPRSDAAPPRSDAAPPEGELLTAELATVGWDQLSGSPVVLLRDIDSGQVLPIWIGLAEAQAISFELHGVELARPMTHDLMANLLSALGAVLEEVVVADLREGTYYGLLKLRVAGEPEPQWIDTRPSDGLALALRTDATIRVAKKLVDELPDFQFMPPESPAQVVRALGLTVVAPSDDLRQEMSLPDRPGLVVIATSGEARRRGLARGDLIVALDGRTPVEPLDLLQAVEESTGRELAVTYLRDGEETTVKLSLTVPERPHSKNVA